MFDVELPFSLEREWRELCTELLPPSSKDSIWRTSYPSNYKFRQRQGWKIHVSASVVSASRTLRTALPLLNRDRVPFKCVNTLKDLFVLNHGLSYGFAQVGKAITVYPESDSHARALAVALGELLSEVHMFGPRIPSDQRIAINSHVYVRYGSFENRYVEIEGVKRPAMVGPDGELVEDRRIPGHPTPQWVAPLFKANPKPKPSKWLRAYAPYGAITQRGKGGVYHAISVGTDASLCVLKEARINGEVDWWGRDALIRSDNEAYVLSTLARHGCKVPQIIAKFRAGENQYLVLSRLPGLTLAEVGASRRLSNSSRVRLCAEVARILCSIHAAGFVWRDCKPHNIIKPSGKNTLYALDFEGTVRNGTAEPMPWGTALYSSQQSSRYSELPRTYQEDTFALGKTMLHILIGAPPDTSGTESLRKLHQYRYSSKVCNIVEALIQEDGDSPTAAECLDSLLSLCSRSSRSK